MTESDIKARLNRIEPIVTDTQKRVSALEKADAVADVHRHNVESRLSAIEDTLKWLVRLIVGALIVALIAFLVSGGLNVPKP